MALAHAILVCLAEKPLTGYDLAKEFDRTVGFFWRADHQQIYRELSALRAKGWLKGERVEQSNRPNKTIYALTEEGRVALRHWSAAPSPMLAIKDDFLLKFHALESMDVEAVRGELADRLEQHRATRALYETMTENKRAAAEHGGTGALGRYLNILIGVRYEDAWIAWCEDALSRLAPVESGSSLPG